MALIEQIFLIMEENEISYLIRGAIFQVYNYFGPGLLESVYKRALLLSLVEKELPVQKEIGISAVYMEDDLGVGFRVDLLVENKVIIEVKSVDELAPVHHKQLLSYLKVANLKLGILVNFNCDNITKSIVRIAHKL